MQAWKKIHPYLGNTYTDDHYSNMDTPQWYAELLTENDTHRNIHVAVSSVSTINVCKHILVHI